MLISRRQALAGLAALSLSGCQVAPGTGRSGFNLLSEEDERSLGQQTHPEILKEFGGAYDDPALSAYVAGLGQRLVRVSETPAADFRFTVLNSPIVNAMALPGGYIYVTRGLLALVSNEAEIAGVLGHEIGHVLARHTAERVSRAQAGGLLAAVLGAVVGVPGVADVAQMGAAAYLQSFSRDQESEADHLGLRYMVRAGWHPQAMVTMLEKLRDQARLEALMAGRSPDSIDQLDFMASHPRTIDRVHAATAEVAGASPTGELGVDTFLDRIDGMAYGDDVAEGVVRDRVFLHPGLGLRFEVPTGFRLVNGDKAVVATHPSGAAIIFDGAQARGVTDMAQYISQVWLPRSPVSNLESIEVGGMPAATAATRGRTKQGDVDVRVVAIRFNGDTIYRFTFATPPNQTSALSVELRRATYSFRRLSAEERAAVKPWRIKVVRTQAGDTAEGLAERMAPAEWKAELFRVINGLQPGDRLEPGRRVKLVVA
ncbi:MAG: M48 family metalloprotease [Magnetospirillum sp.]|nr:M48 family metalloprotease [Magnetospirillum sp.]